MRRALPIVILAVLVSACASAPPPAPVKPVEPTFEQKMASILRLEDHRVLRDPAAIAAPPPPVAVRGQQPIVVPPPQPPDLVRLLGDAEARIRRRAALAIG